MSLKIQIQSVIFLACNYFYIIYCFDREQQKQLKIYAPLWATTRDGSKNENIYLGPDE